MIPAFTQIEPTEIAGNIFRLIADDWMLVTAGDLTSFNTMTVSWGSMGELWNKKICICFVRPTRHTYEFMERTDSFTLCVFGAEHRSILNYCGKVSGRDVDKMHIKGLSPRQSGTGSVFFAEAHLVFDCRKIYSGDLDPSRFLTPDIDACYPKKDYHRMYIGEISACLRRDQV